MDIIGWEKSLIGTVLYDPPSYYEAINLNPQDFQSKQNAMIWNRVIELAQKDALSKRTLSELMRSHEELDKISSGSSHGEEYFEECMLMADITTVGEFVRVIRDESIKRRMMSLGVTLTNNAKNGHEAKEIYEAHVQELLKISFDASRDFRKIGAGAPELTKYIELEREGNAPEPWRPKLPAVKGVIPRLQPIDLWILAGEPGTGKSSYVRFEALKSALEGETTLLFTYENSFEECVSWAVAHMTGIDHADIIEPRKLSEENVDKVRVATEKLGNLPLYIIEMGGTGLPALAAYAKRMALMHNIKAIFIDGMYLMEGNGNGKYETISDNSQGLRTLAMEVHTPIIATTQYRRIPENKTPTINDLLYAGEKPARIIAGFNMVEMSLYETEMFPENKVDGKLLTGKNRNAVVLKLDVMKFTNGKMGTSEEIKWNKHTGSYYTLDHSWRGKQRSFTPKPK